jgi:hypothetical protein
MQKDFVDPATSSAALLAGEAILPTVTAAVAVARQRGIFIVWVSPSNLGLSLACSIWWVIITVPLKKFNRSFLRISWEASCYSQIIAYI